MPIAQGIRQCSYVRPDGRRCGSPALVTDDRCFHHHRSRKPDPVELTPHLRELADIFADPLFHDHLQLLSNRLNDGSATMQELENTISTLIGCELRELSSQGTSSLAPNEVARSAFNGVNEVSNPASAASEIKNPRSSAFICG